jgi:hypothetical protein
VCRRYGKNLEKTLNPDGVTLATRVTGFSQHVWFHQPAKVASYLAFYVDK